MRSHHPRHRIVARVLEAIGAATLLILMTIVFVDVVGRNLLNTPLPWGTEILEIVLALMVFALYPLLALNSSHITVDLIRVRPVLQKAQRALADAVGAMVFALIAWCMGRQALRAASYGEATPLLNVPLSWVLGGIAIMAAVSAAAFLLAMVRVIRRRGEPGAPISSEVI